jgi:hypothetical protein
MNEQARQYANLYQVIVNPAKTEVTLNLMQEVPVMDMETGEAKQPLRVSVSQVMLPGNAARQLAEALLKLLSEDNGR